MERPIAIRFEQVSKQFKQAGYPAVNQADFAVDEGEFVTILGSSGCGKTTLLKMVNRLYEPDKGKIILFGEDISTLDPVVVRRRIGYVIQQVGLFPHMTIEENVATVPKLLGWKKERITKRGRELMELVGLDPDEFLKRYPGQLSGGQQQRVGLVRALAADPKIMLMDEPFGAIDAINRNNLQQEIKRIHKKTGKTILFVTHDINEAFKLGTRVMIMNEGRICQFDKPERIARAPVDPFTRSLIQSAMEQEELWRRYRD